MQPRKHVLTCDYEQTDALAQDNQAGWSYMLSGCCCYSCEKACMLLTTSGCTASMRWRISSEKLQSGMFVTQALK